MKTKCENLKASVVLAFAAFMFALALLVTRCLFDLSDNNIISYLYDLAIGVFGSSIVILAFSVKEYRNARSELMKEFWLEVEKINEEIKKIGYIYVDLPKDYLLNNIREFQANKDSENEVLDAHNKLYDFILNNYLDEEIKKLKGKKLENYIENIINEETNKLINDINKEVPNYIELANLSTAKLNFIIGDTMFFKETELLNEMYKFIYSPLYDLINQIKVIVNDVKTIQNSDNKDVSNVLDDILRVQSTIYLLKYKENNKVEVYQEYTYKLDKTLETFRAKVNNEEPKYDKQSIYEIYESKISENIVMPSKEEEKEEGKKEE